MTNTKEYNEAVKKIVNGINSSLLSLEIEDIVKFTINALGIEIVSRESKPVDKESLEDVIQWWVDMPDDDLECVEEDIPPYILYNLKKLAYYTIKFSKIYNKPEVYLENIKRAE